MTAIGKYDSVNHRGGRGITQSESRGHKSKSGMNLGKRVAKAEHQKTLNSKIQYKVKYFFPHSGGIYLRLNKIKFSSKCSKKSLSELMRSWMRTLNKPCPSRSHD